MSETLPDNFEPGAIEIDLVQIKNRSISGIIALTSRTFLVQIISAFATFALTVLLDPPIYGTFFLVSAAVNFLTYFSDIGLAAALIQKKERPSKDDFATTFTVQQILVISLLVLLFIFTPYLKQTYNLNSEGVWLMWTLGLALMISSLKTIPTVLLERSLQFNKLVIPQIAENLVYNLTAVFFAWRGFGITTFTLAILAREIVGLILMYIVSPWRPRFALNTDSIKHLLKFGLPYQTNSFLATIKDNGITLVLGKLIGLSGLGYLNWASKWPSIPLSMFMDNVTKVTFPAMARIQHDKALLKKSIERTLFFLTLIIFPILAGTGLVFPKIIGLIPKYSKWEPAIIPLYFYLLNGAWASVSTPLSNALSAIGHIKITFKLMVMWTLLTWILMPIMAWKFGYVGVAAAVGIISFSSAIVLVAMYRIVPVNYLEAFKTPILATLAMSGIVFVTRPFIHSLVTVTPVIIIGVITYALAVYLLEGSKLIIEVRQLLKTRHH